MANIEALKSTLAVVQEAAKVGLWKQAEWMTQEEYALEDASPLDYQGQHYCGTAGCFAGWAVMLDGWKPVKDEDDVSWGFHLEKDGEQASPSQVEGMAMDILDLPYQQGARLFHGDNSLERLQEIVADLIAKEEAGGEDEDEYDDVFA